MTTHEPFGPTVARRVVILITFFTVALIGVSSCASRAPASPAAGHSTAPPNDAQDPWEELYRYRAFVYWSCSEPAPIAFVRVDLQLSLDEQIETLKHEKNHDDFMRSFGSCGAFHEWVSDSENRLTMEALGACAAIRHRVASGGHPEAARARAVANLAYSYGFTVSYERAQRRLDAVCPS